MPTKQNSGTEPEVLPVTTDDEELVVIDEDLVPLAKQLIAGHLRKTHEQREKHKYPVINDVAVGVIRMLLHKPGYKMFEADIIRALIQKRPDLGRDSRVQVVEMVRRKIVSLRNEANRLARVEARRQREMAARKALVDALLPAS